MSALLKPEPQGQERRRHSRVKVTVEGRLMLESKEEFPCKTIDMSPGGLRLRTAAKGRVGERVVAYLDHFGRVEGVIVRFTGEGFALKLSLPLVKRERVADLLTWLASLAASGMVEDRRHQRIVPGLRETTLHLGSGHTFPAHIIDISVSGSGIALEKHPEIGTRVLVGKTPGKVVRHFPGGIAIEFLRLIPTETFDEDIVL